MTNRQAAFVGGLVGLVAATILLTLLYFYGVRTDLRLILWPFSVMLTTGWYCTVRGLLITIAAIAYNCLAYMGVTLLLRASVKFILRPGRK